MRSRYIKQNHKHVDLTLCWRDQPTKMKVKTTEYGRVMEGGINVVCSALDRIREKKKTRSTDKCIDSVMIHRLLYCRGMRANAELASQKNTHNVTGFIARRFVYYHRMQRPVTETKAKFPTGLIKVTRSKRRARRWRLNSMPREQDSVPQG